FDLTLYVTDGGDRFEGALEYSTDLFDQDTIDRMTTHLVGLLESVVRNQDAPLVRLELLTDTERRRVLTDWNAPETPYAQGETVHGLFEEQAKRTPDAVAVVFGDHALTYRALNERCNRLAHRLASRGVSRETLVAVVMERSLDLVEALLSVLKTGAAYV